MNNEPIIAIEVARKIAWRMAVVKGLLFSVVSAGTCWLTATNQIDMTLLGTWDWVQTGIGVFVAWGTVMMAYLSKSAQALMEGKLPNGDK